MLAQPKNFQLFDILVTYLSKPGCDLLTLRALELHSGHLQANQCEGQAK